MSVQTGLAGIGMSVQQCFVEFENTNIEVKNLTQYRNDIMLWHKMLITTLIIINRLPDIHNSSLILLSEGNCPEWCREWQV